MSKADAEYELRRAYTLVSDAIAWRLIEVRGARDWDRFQRLRQLNRVVENRWDYFVVGVLSEKEIAQYTDWFKQKLEEI